jgi:hypothetical protein
MTWNTSSDNLFAYDRKMLLKRNMGIFLTFLAIMLVLIPFATAGIPGRSIFNEAIHPAFAYRIISPRFVIVSYYTVIAGSVILGLSLYSFLRDPSREEMFFSLGLTRKQLFQSRFQVGAFGIGLAVGIPMLVSLIVNLIAYGGSARMLCSWLAILCGLLIQGMTAFLLTAAACILSGTATEIVLYELMLFGGFTGLVYSINQILYHIVWNNLEPTTLILQYHQGVDLVRGLDAWNPITLYLRLILTHASAAPGQEAAGYQIVRLIVWAGIAFVLRVLAGKAMQIRHAEQAGRDGRRIQVTRIVVFLSMFVLFAVMFSLLDSSNRVFAVVIGLLADLILYIIWQQSYIKQHPGFWVLASRCLTMLVAVAVLFAITSVAGTRQAAKKNLQNPSVSYKMKP